MQKFPLVRLKQFWGNPFYLFFWIRRAIWYKYSSFEFISKYDNYQTLSPEETLEYIIEQDMSIIRFGDGEFGILSGAGIYPPNSDWSQRYSSSLKLEIERQLCIQHPKILLAFPSREHLIYKEGDTPKLDVVSNMHTEMRMFLWKYLHKEKIYGNCLVFLPQHHKNMDWKKMSSYLSNKTVVVVTGGVNKLRNISLGGQTFFVEAGKHNAFERKEELLARIDELIINKKLDPKQTLFWISLGCTAGCLVEHLTEKKFVAWDTGHIFRFAEQKLRELV